MRRSPPVHLHICPAGRLSPRDRTTSSWLRCMTMHRSESRRIAQTRGPAVGRSGRRSVLKSCVHPRTDHSVRYAPGGLPGDRSYRAERRECARSPRPHVSLSVTAGGVRTHRAAGTAPAGLHRDVHGRPAAGRNPGLPDDSGLASASRPRIARGPQAPGRAARPSPEPGPRARRHPGAPRPGPRSPPCAVTLDQLHRQGDGPRAAGTTDGDASAPRQSRKTPSAAVAVPSH